MKMICICDYTIVTALLEEGYQCTHYSSQWYYTDCQIPPGQKLQLVGMDLIQEGTLLTRPEDLAQLDAEAEKGYQEHLARINAINKLTNP